MLEISLNQSISGLRPPLDLPGLGYIKCLSRLLRQSAQEEVGTLLSKFINKDVSLLISM
jgi:hypothetical protein